MAAKFQDYYVTLGVARTASADEIKQAFRALARLYHPDVAKNKVTGEVKFKEINEAYEVLGDPEKRRRYDELGPDGTDGGADFRGGGFRPRAGSGPQDYEFGGTGFSDFFESFFGGRGAAGGARGEPFPRMGDDVEADLLVTLEEALHGSTRKVTLRRPGAGGEKDRTDTYQVKIPAGVRQGQRIRLAGQGTSGHGGAPTGDLYLRVQLARHPDFSVQGADLHCELDLAPWEAVLGVQVKIPTLGGLVSLRVAPGTAAGIQLRLRGLGLPRDDGTRGDVYATVRLRTPTPVTGEERVLWEKLSVISKFKPRSENHE